MIAESLRHHLGDLPGDDLEVFFRMPDGTLMPIDTLCVDGDGRVILICVDFNGPP